MTAYRGGGLPPRDEPKSYQAENVLEDVFREVWEHYLKSRNFLIIDSSCFVSHHSLQGLINTLSLKLKERRNVRILVPSVLYDLLLDFGSELSFSGIVEIFQKWLPRIPREFIEQIVLGLQLGRSTTEETRNGSDNSSRSKPKKTKFEIQHLINEIGKMLSTGRPDREIMDQLQIKRSQYYVYKSKLFQQSAELFDRLNDKNRDSLIFHKELLSERLTRLYKQAELDLTQNTPIEGGNNRASIYLAAQNIAINIFKLESEGLRILANGQGRQLRGLDAYNGERDVNHAAIQKKRDETEYDESKIF
jgi:hypothetical protein